MPERIHSDQGAQFESHLMKELCTIWGTEKSHTTPYHPEGNGVVERGNRDLGDSLRSLLLEADEQEWDLLLPQIMRSIRASPHHSTGETANFMMFGRELRLPDQLVYGKSLERPTSREAYAIGLQDRLHKVHEVLRQHQKQIQSHDFEAEPAFTAGDYVMMVNKRLKKGQTAKLAPKYVGPYKVLQALPNRTYHITRDGQASVENESRLKKFLGPLDPRAEAPVVLEPARRRTMMGRPARPPKSIPPAILDRLQGLDDKTNELEKNQRRNSPKDDPRRIPSDLMAADLPDLFATPEPAPTKSPLPVSTEPYRELLLHDHTYSSISRKSKLPESTSHVIVTPKVATQRASPPITVPPAPPEVRPPLEVIQEEPNLNGSADQTREGILRAGGEPPPLLIAPESSEQRDNAPTADPITGERSTNTNPTAGVESTVEPKTTHSLLNKDSCPELIDVHPISHQDSLLSAESSTGEPGTSQQPAPAIPKKPTSSNPTEVASAVTKGKTTKSLASKTVSITLKPQQHAQTSKINADSTSARTTRAGRESKISSFLSTNYVLTLTLDPHGNELTEYHPEAEATCLPETQHLRSEVATAYDRTMRHASATSIPQEGSM